MRYMRHGVLWIKASRAGERSWMNRRRGCGFGLDFGGALGAGSAGELEKSLHDKNTGGRRLDEQNESSIKHITVRSEKTECHDRERDPETTTGCQCHPCR